MLLYQRYRVENEIKKVDGAGVVLDAYDELLARPVSVLEWRCFPDAPTIEALGRIDFAGEEADLFTSAGSVYLIVPRDERKRAALEKAQAAGGFPGCWWAEDAPLPAAPPPVPQPLQPAHPPVPAPQKRSLRWAVACVAVATVAISCAGWYAFVRWSSLPAPPPAVLIAPPVVDIALGGNPPRPPVSDPTPPPVPPVKPTRPSAGDAVALLPGTRAEHPAEPQPQSQPSTPSSAAVAAPVERTPETRPDAARSAAVVAPAPRRERIEILRPGPAPARPPRPAVSSGILVWSGELQKDIAVVLDGAAASAGALHGAPLPGIPVIVDVDPPDMAIAEAPSARNGWRRLAFRSNKKRRIVVTVRWRLLGE